MQYDDTHFVSLTVRGHTWMFIWRDGQGHEAIRHAVRFAADPEVDFSWFNAACVSRQVRKLSERRNAR